MWKDFNDLWYFHVEELHEMQLYFMCFMNKSRHKCLMQTEATLGNIEY